MTSKLIPPNPEQVMVIRDIAPNVTTLSVPFLRFGRIKIGGRATIVRLQTNSLAIFSPVALTPTVIQKLHSLSPSPPTTYLIAPDTEHYLFLSSWASHYPNNHHIIAPSPLASKLQKQNPSLKITTLFTPSNKSNLTISPDFDSEFAHEYIPTHPNNEIIFLHKPSKTLIEADLIFNLPAKEQYSLVPAPQQKPNFLTKLFTKLQNTQGDAIWQKRMLWYVFAARDRRAFGESLKRIDSWDFVNLVPCHGETVLGDGKEVFRRVAGWFLEEGKKGK